MKTTLIMPQARIDESGTITASPSLDPNVHDELTRLQAALTSTATGDVSFTFVRFPNRRIVLIGTVRRKQIWVRSLARVLYERLPDPFLLSAISSPNWSGNSLTDIPLGDILPPLRDCKLLQSVLKDGDSPFLLGGCQTLCDQGKIILHRPQPDEKTIRDLWMLLPRSIQSRTSFSAFAPDNSLAFDLVALPVIPESHPGYLNEDQARDYPESRYERELQSAIESGDEASLNALLNRRSSSDTLKLAFMLVIGMALLSVAGKLLMR